MLFDGGHAFGCARVKKFLGGGLIFDEPFDGFGSLHQFVDAGAPLVAGVVADIASLAAFEHQVRAVFDAQSRELFGAVVLDQIVKFFPLRVVFGHAAFAQTADQALGQNAEKGVGKIQRVEPHVQKPCDRFWCAVGVQGGQDQVAGQGCLYADGGGLMVAHLADHDDIRVGPKKSPHDPGKIQADFGFAFDLPQSRLSDFHRVLGRPDFDSRFVDMTQHGVQGGGLAGTGGTDHQNQAVGLGGDFFNDAQIPFVQPHAVNVHGAGFGQDAQHRIFEPAGGGEGGQPKFKRLDPFSLEFDFAVLGQPAFGNVQTAHDLEPAQKGTGIGVGKLKHFLADAVDAKPDHGLFGQWRRFDVYIAGVLSISGNQNLVHQANDLP